MILIELALRMPVRVLHSGMFATRRIYRPLWSMFAPTAVSLVVIGVGVFLYPAGAIVIAIIASNAISIWITVHYTVRAYRLTGLWPKFGGRSIRHLLPSIPPRLGIEATLSGLGLRLDAVAVLLIAGIWFCRCFAAPMKPPPFSTSISSACAASRRSASSGCCSSTSCCG